MEKLLPKEIYDSFKREGISLFCYESVDSTNKLARRYVEQAEGLPTCPALFIADSQSEGRGRQGRSFYSPALTGLYMTLLFEAPESARSFERFTALAAVASLEAINDVFSVSASIKWVNDLYIGGKKIAGILAESFPKREKRYIALGIGVNLATEDFPEELRHKAGSITQSSDAEELSAQRLALAFLISVKLIGALGGEGQSEYMRKYREASCVIGKDIRFLVANEEKRGRAIDITDSGALVVSLESGEKISLSTGEISIFSLDRAWL